MALALLVMYNLPGVQPSAICLEYRGFHAGHIDGLCSISAPLWFHYVLEQLRTSSQDRRMYTQQRSLVTANLNGHDIVSQAVVSLVFGMEHCRI
jgi:hypothetical protein